MSTITIDNKPCSFNPGETILSVARRNNIPIPTLCFAGDAIHKASCMVCAVRNNTNGQIIPSCSTSATDGMEIESGTDSIKTIRKTSLELLLSDHRADCEGPCQKACPGSLDIAVMNRLIESGKNDEAIKLLRNSLVFPASLCYLCKAPCESICRRGEIVEPVKVREIKKKLVNEEKDIYFHKPAVNPVGRAAVGPSSPAALGVAWQLAGLGWAVTIFEPSGQAVKPHLSNPGDLPDEVLDYELSIIKKAGITIELNNTTRPQGFDAVIDAGGGTWSPDSPFQVIYKVKHPARLVYEGIKTALKVHRTISKTGTQEILHPSENPAYNFKSTFTKLDSAEKNILKQTPEFSSETGCLFCDCNAKENCRLRDHSSLLECNASTYNKESKRKVGKQHLHGQLWFEQAKCISCGLCVYNTDNGATFQGRGFDMQVVIPPENAVNIPESIAGLCPTGALVISKQ